MSKNATGTQVDQNREDEDGRISQDTATPTALTNQADNSGGTFVAILQLAGSLVVLTIAVLFCLLIVKMSLGAYRGMHNFLTVTPAEQAVTNQRIDADDAAWAKDPRNPKVVGQNCLDKGGTPTYSAWDGRVTSCKGADNKNVSIEVNQ